MTLISALFLIFIFSIQTIEATGPKDLNPEKTKADANLSQSSAVSGAKNKIDLKKDPAKMKKDLEKQKQALLKKIILEDASSSADLTDPDKKYIQDQSLFKDMLVSKGFKIRVEDNQFLDREKLYNFIENPSKIKALLNKAEFIEKIMEAIKAEHKLTGEHSYSLNTGKWWDTGSFEIYFYKNAAKSLKNLKNMIIADLENCRDLEESELQALKNDDKIYDSKYIENACEILIEDRNLANLIGENKVESFKDTDYKQEIADQVNKPNLNLDKHMSVYLKVQDMTKGRIGVILADTKREKKSALIEALEILRDSYPPTDLNKKAIEKAYGVQYINLGVALIWDDNRFQSGGEFDKSFALIDEILNDPTRKTAWIDKTNQYRREFRKIQQAIPNDENTIIRSRVSSGKGYISIFTLSESPKESIQSHLLDWIDSRIKSIKSYSAIKYKKSINDFEEERILKQGLKIRAIYDDRLEEGGSLSSYYDNAKGFNPLLDDADFKRKVITKINDYQTKDEKLKKELKFPFSTDNLENIKIQVQDFKEGYYFDLVVYELYPPGESAPTNPSTGESAEPAADGESEVSGESPTDGASAVDGD